MQTWKQKLTSRKFILAVATALVNLYFIVTGKDVDPELVISFTAIIAAWITGETVLDRKAIEFSGVFAQKLAMAQLMELASQIDAATKADSPVVADEQPYPYEPTPV